jgi:MFS family permease
MRGTDPNVRRPTYTDALRDARFRVLLTSRSLAVVADSLRTVALSVLVFQTTGSAWLAAITYGISFLPQVLGGILLGSLAGRVPPRRLMVAGYATECGVAVVLSTPLLPVAADLALVFAVAVYTPILAGASNRLVAEVLLDEDVYVLGRSLSNIAASTAQVAGLAFGGLAVATLGPRPALLVAAVAHLAAAVIVRVGLPQFPASSATGPRSLVRDSLLGNARLMRDREVRTLLLAQWLPPAFVVGAESLIIPYAASRGTPPDTAGVLLACIPAGMIVGNFAVGRLVRPAQWERVTIPLLVVLSVPLIGLAAYLPTWVTAGLLAVSGVGFAYGLGLQQRFLHAVAEPDRGIAFGLLSTGVMTLQGVGPIVFGGLAEVIGVDRSIAAAGGVTLAVTAVIGVALRRGVQIELEEDPAPTENTTEIPLLGGDITDGLVRVGATVRRPHQPHSAAVVAYLGHLRAAGFESAPRYRGRDERGRDVLDFIEGDVPGNPIDPWAATTAVMVEVAHLLRRLHDTSITFRPDPHLLWFGQSINNEVSATVPPLFDEPELISHCDVTPQNTVFRDGHPVALIDFDSARPTIRLLDVLDTATWWVPLVHPQDRAPAHRDVDVPARLRQFLDAYGLEPELRAQFLDLAHRAARRSYHLMETAARDEGGGWARMWNEGVGQWIRRRHDWLTTVDPVLAAALTDHRTTR